MSSLPTPPAGYKNAHLPVPRGYIPTTTIGNFIYTGGGSMFDPVAILVDSTDSFRYDPVADSIITIASIPRATAETRALTLNGQMWVMGGGRTAPNPSNEVDIYNPGTNSWSIGTPFVTARRNFPTDTDGCHIWLAGGYAPTTPTDSMEIFCCGGGGHTPTPTATATATATPSCTPGGTPGPWTLAAPYPLIIESPAVTSAGTFGYSAGGFAGAPTNAFYRYDLATNVWTPLANMLTGAYDAGIAYAANTNKIYVFGGLDPNFFVLATTQIYDIATNSWTMGAPMPDAAGRYFPSAVYYSGNGKIYVMGGFDGATFSEQSQTWEYDPVANTWNTSRAPIPVAMGGAGYSIVGQFAYLAGHWNNGAGSTDHYRYDIVANSWSPVASVPVAIYRPAAAGVGTQEFLVGGGDPDISAKATQQQRVAASMRAPTTSYTSTYIYDTIGNSWTTGPNTNVAHSFTGGTAIANTLLVVGGFDGVTGDTNVVERSELAGPCGGTPTPTPTATPTPTCSPGGGTPGPWTQAAPVAIDHYGGFMDSDGTFAYEGGGYSFSAGDNINQFGKFDPVANTLDAACAGARSEQRAWLPGCMRPT